MTATERLRAMLDERGVEHRFNQSTKVFEWRFEGTDGEGSAHATEVDGGINMMACSLTPEQAVAATLGPGTCHPEEQYLDSHSDLTVTVCSECGVPTDDLEDCNYCPNCGRKVAK